MEQKAINRVDGRAWDDIRPVSITPDFITSAAGSCLIACGNTRVICTASVEEKVPPFLENAGLGWLTAEYSMLPASASSRMTREKVSGSGRTFEIQRLIGRSLRAALDRKKLGLRTITIDCDVIQADGGTRTASVTGGFVALALAVRKLLQNGTLRENPIVHQVAAISLGKVSGDLLLDLNFIEDSSADIDANMVATPEGELIEWQTTAERALLPLADLGDMTALGMKGIRELVALQRQIIGEL
ncbi:MAG: ribonuclease PH [Proteobacteria bacterium]|nr:ribonuclease PH [Pseudomonadota bacterium]